MAINPLSNTSIWAGLLRRTLTLARRLVEPLAGANERKRRHQGYPSSFLLIMAVISVAGGLVMLADFQGIPPAALLYGGAISGVLFLAGYAFSRTNHYAVGTAIAVILPAAPIVIAMLMDSPPERIAGQLPWLALPLLACSLLLSLLQTAIIASSYFIIVLASAFWSDVPPGGLFKALAYIVMLITFIIVVTAIRRRDEHEPERRPRERAPTEKAPSESEEKFAAAFKMGPNAICIISVSEGQFVAVNESFSRFTGYSMEEILGRTPVELRLFVNEEELNLMASTLQEKQSMHNQEFRSSRKSGEIRQGVFSAEVINIGGRPSVIMNIIDITEHKRAEQLREDENHILTMLSQGAELEDLLDAILHLSELRDPSIKGSVLLLDRARGMLFLAAGPSLSEEFKQYLSGGLPIGEGVGCCGTAAYRGRRVVVTDIGRSHFFQPEAVTLARRNNLHSCWSQPIISSTGEILGTIAEYGNRAGEPGPQTLAVLEWSTRIAAIAIERHRAEQALRDSEEKFSRAFHASPDIVVISRLSDLRFIEVNDSFIRQTGYTREDLAREPSIASDLLGNLPDRDRVVRVLKSPVSIRNQETRYQNKKGEVGTLLFSSEPINLGGEKCKITIARDITELKRTEEELKKAVDELETLKEAQQKHNGDDGDNRTRGKNNQKKGRRRGDLLLYPGPADRMGAP